MANFQPSAPFFGVPPYPQPFPPQSAPPPPSSGPAYQNAPQQQHPPQQPQAHNPSGFGQNTSLPQMDFQALGLSPAQLAALWQQVQNGTAPPPLPFPPPFSAQPGFAPPPPPPIPFPAGFQPSATPSFPVPPPQVLPGITAVPQPPAPATSLPAPNNRVMEIVNGDKEEGELSDEPGSQDEQGRSWSRGDSQRNGRGDCNHPRMPAAVLRGPTWRPRNSDRPDELSRTDLKETVGTERYGYGMPPNDRKPSSPRWHGRQENRSPLQSPRDRAHREVRTESLLHLEDKKNSDAQTSAQPRSGQTAFEHTHFDMLDLEAKKRQAETFLAVLHTCGYGYADLQKCGFDPKLVKEIWTSLGFPIAQESLGNGTPSLPAESKTESSGPSAPEGLLASGPAVTAAMSAAPATHLPSKPQPTVGTAGTNKASAGATTSSPTDRAAYIARLMAAKNSKANVKTTATSPATPSPAPAPAVETHTPSQPDPTPSVNQDATPKQENAPVPDPAVLAAQKKEAQNELLRRKIEALKIPKKKAEEEARAKAQAIAASLSANRTPSSSSASIAPTSKSEIPVRPAYQGTATAGSTPAKDPQSSSMPLQSPGGIPGLFMTAPTPPTAPRAAQELPAFPANKGRKRPVAADFEDLQQSRPSTAFKRPFGQSHNDHEQMIIEVSDDETVGSVMDIDEADELQPSAQQSSQPLPKVGAHRNMPPLTNFPARPNFSRQGSAQSTPPATQTPISAAKIEDLRRKEEEIAALKKKLAEKERQRLAKAQSSRAQTPATPTYQPSQSHHVVSPSATAAGQGVLQTQSAAQSDSASRTDTPTASALTHTPQSPAESEWKRRRRAEIQSGISAFDADLNSNMSRLEQLRREMEQIEAENRRRQQEKETLINELENLGIDTEGMPHEELQAKKDEIMQQKEAAAAAAVEASTNAINVIPLVESTTASQPTPGQTHQNYAPRSEAKAPSESSGEQMSMSEGEVDEESDTTEAEMDMSDSDIEKEVSVPIQTAASTVEATAVPETVEQTQTALLSEESQSKPADPAETSEQEDTEDFYSPEPQVDVLKIPESSAANAEASSAEDTSHGLEAGDNGVAGQEEEEYAPLDMVEQQSYGLETAPLLGQSETQVISDEYSGPEVSEAPDNTTDAQRNYSAPSSESLQTEVTKQAVSDESQADDASSEAMDEGDDEYDPSQMLPGPSPSAPSRENLTPPAASIEGVAELIAPRSATGSQASDNAMSESGNSGSETPAETPQITIVADEVAPELRSRNLEGGENDHSVPGDRDVKEHSYYAPYESPLKNFKAYRYHPQYSHSVSGGFRSLTYSHEIDPMKPVCPFETAGGICNDSACEGQHFRAMSISEDKILVQLGIVNLGRTPEEQEQWRVGLKQVLKGLREQNVRDAESVAAAITNYRREFLQDPSKVLNI